MAVVTRHGKKRDPRTGKAREVAHKHLKTRIPGWGVFRKSANTTSESVAREYDRMIQQIGKQGAADALDALQDGKITLARALVAYSRAGIAGVREEIAAVDRRPLDDRLIQPLIDRFLKEGSPRKRERRARTNRDYATHLRAMIEAFGGAEKANLGQLITGEETGAFIDGVYRRLLERAISVRECRAQVSPRQRRQWTELRRRSEDELSALPDDEVAGRSTHEDRAAAGATANRYRATVVAFVNWLLRADQEFRETTGNVNGPANVQKYEERHVGDEHMTREEWRIFRAEAVEYDTEYPSEALDEPHPCVLLWDMLLATGATTYTEGVERLRLSSFRPATRRNGRMQIRVVGTKNVKRTTRDIWIDSSLYDRCLEFANRWGIGHDEPLFASMSARRVGRAFAIICERVAEKHARPDFTRFTPYSLRHTFAVWQVQGEPEAGVPGVSIVQLAYLMGHGDNISTTMRYAKHADTESHHAAGIMARAMATEPAAAAPAAEPARPSPADARDPLEVLAEQEGIPLEKLRAIIGALRT